MKRILLLTVIGTVVLAFGSSASAVPGPTLVISHKLHGCHNWSLNGGAWKVTQHIKIARGGSLIITNNDVMFHQVVKTSGPAVSFKLLKTGMAMKGTVKLPWPPGLMGRPGATLKVTFSKAGVYRLKTKFGEDYMPMPATIGEDNVLRLVVTVS